RGRGETRHPGGLRERLRPDLAGGGERAGRPTLWSAARYQRDAGRSVALEPDGPGEAYRRESAAGAECPCRVGRARVPPRENRGVRWLHSGKNPGVRARAGSGGRVWCRIVVIRG